MNMTRNIQAPAKGEPLRASWAGEVTSILNAFPDKVGAPFRNERNRRTTATDYGCWTISSSTREEEVEGETVNTPVRVFANQYYLDGEVIHELELEDAVEDFVCQGELEEGEEYTEDDRPYVALKVPASTDGGDATLEGYATLSDLQAAQNDVAYVVKPLYKFTHSGSVAVDFRNCPALQVTEELL